MFIYIYKDTCLLIFTKTHNVYLHIDMFIYIYTGASVNLYIDTYLYLLTKTYSVY